MNRIAILGASGHGKVVAECALASGWSKVSFYDDAWPQKTTVGSWEVKGDLQVLLKELDDFDGVAVAIGRNDVRMAKLAILHSAEAPVVTLVHPSAVISSSATLGTGVVVMAGVVINADACVADGVILNTSCSVDHDCVLGAGTHISPGAHLAGGVRVGERAWIGMGAVVRQCQHVGTDAVVGAGAAVVANVPDGVTVAGVPAVLLRTHDV